MKTNFLPVFLREPTNIYVPVNILKEVWRKREHGQRKEKLCLTAEEFCADRKLNMLSKHDRLLVMYTSIPFQAEIHSSFETLNPPRIHINTFKILKNVKQYKKQDAITSVTSFFLHSL